MNYTRQIRLSQDFLDVLFYNSYENFAKYKYIDFNKELYDKIKRTAS